MKVISQRKELLAKLKLLLAKEHINSNEYEELQSLLNLRLGLFYEKIIDDIYERHINDQKYVFLKKHIYCPDKLRSDAQTHGALIESDNLLALFLLQNIYQNKIDLIYIDPPYNTGSTGFVYQNDYKINGDDQNYLHIKDKDSFRHSKWLSIIEPRLKLARKLLKNTGLIAISIDDNEVYHLKLLMDKIFGVDCFKGTLIWKKGPGIWSHKSIQKTHEYILIYEKKFNASQFIFSTLEKNIAKEESLIMRGSQGDRWKTPGLWYPIICTVHNKEVLPINSNKEEKTWSISKQKYEIEKQQKNIICKPTKDNQCKIYRKYTQKIKQDSLYSICNLYNAHDNKTKCLCNQDFHDWKNTDAQMGSKDLKKDLSSNKNSFDYPKPVNLLRNLFKFLCPQNGIVLDFYGGSGTTGCAISELNKIDNGKRQFILVSNHIGDKKSKHKTSIFRDTLYPRLANNVKKYNLSLKIFMSENDKELKFRSSEDNFFLCKKPYLETCKNLLEILNLNHQAVISKKFDTFQVNKITYGCLNDSSDVNVRDKFILKKISD